LNWIKEISSQIANLDSSAKEIKKFGLVIMVALTIIASIIYYKSGYSIIINYLLGSGIVLLVSAILSPNILVPIYKVWMSLAFILGSIVSRIILTILFYFLISPIGIIIKIFGNDIINLKIDKERKSYWIKKDEKAKPDEQIRKMY
jgi:uncharacterized membrane protein